MSANFKTSIIRFKDADGNVLTIDALKGDTGDSGVHIGKTAPTDPLKSVWIDSSNTAQSVLNIKNGQNKWESVPAIRGTDGHTPVRGKDYWTPEDQSAINADIDNKIETISESLKEALATQIPVEVEKSVEEKTSDFLKKADIKKLESEVENKIEKPVDAPTVGKVLKVKSVNADGTFVCEWADETETDLTGYVKDTDYATSSKAGVLCAQETWSGFGVMQNASHTLFLSKASNAVIDGKSNEYNPIVPSNLDYAVKSGLADSKIEWTEAEKAEARKMIGINSLISFNDQTIEHSAEGLGQAIASLFPNADYNNPAIVAGTFALHGNTSLIYGTYRPRGNCWLMCLTGTVLKALYKTNQEVWSFVNISL